jgi:Tfp pilus assembly protein PilN
MNLVKTVRETEKRHLKHKANMVLMSFICFGLLVFSGFYVFSQIMAMESTLAREKDKLRMIEAEYRNYHEATSVIDKADIELLNQLQSNRIYWTRKLEAMASHLPDEQPVSYWITKFGYRDNSKTFTVGGYGYITQRQEQLLALDSYLNNLRADANFSDVFSSTFLKSTERQDDNSKASAVRERVSFEYASVRKGAARR